MHREDELVDWLRGLQPGSGLGLPGDDAAVLGRGASARAVTVDQQIAGVHLPADTDAAVWARRLLAVNLSDLAAMGAEPRHALLTLAVPETFDLRRFLRALVDACADGGITLAGGDTARASQAVTTLTLIGRRRARCRWLARTGARPGDRLWLGGPVGLSAAGQRLVARGARLETDRVHLPAPFAESPRLSRAARRAVRRHLQPEPQLELGAWLASRRRAAAIDLSDGLGRDLDRLCRASGVGAVLDEATLPLAPELLELASVLAERPLELGLGGGEDYVLLFALPPTAEPPSRFAARPIGRITDGDRLELDGPAGRRDLEPTGWDHLA